MRTRNGGLRQGHGDDTVRPEYARKAAIRKWQLFKGDALLPAALQEKRTAIAKRLNASRRALEPDKRALLDGGIAGIAAVADELRQYCVLVQTKWPDLSNRQLAEGLCLPLDDFERWVGPAQPPNSDRL